MTNTLHRFGDAESFYDDYIVFAIASKGKQRSGSAAQAAQVPGNGAAEYKPVNLGDARHGGALRPSRK